MSVISPKKSPAPRPVRRITCPDCPILLTMSSPERTIYIERRALHRLFQNFDERVAPVDAFAAVSRHEHERDAAVEQAVGDRIDELATQIDVEDRSLRRIVLDGPHGVRHACAGRRDTDAEI